MYHFNQLIWYGFIYIDWCFCVTYRLTTINIQETFISVHKHSFTNKVLVISGQYLCFFEKPYTFDF